MIMDASEQYQPSHQYQSHENGQDSIGCKKTSAIAHDDNHQRLISFYVTQLVWLGRSSTRDDTIHRRLARLKCSSSQCRSQRRGVTWSTSSTPRVGAQRLVDGWLVASGCCPSENIGDALGYGWRWRERWPMGSYGILKCSTLRGLHLRFLEFSTDHPALRWRLMTWSLASPFHGSLRRSETRNSGCVNPTAAGFNMA